MLERGARSALAIFVALEVIALPTLLVLASNSWFGIDDWDFLAQRDGGDIGDLLRPHNEHWSTLPILVYRALFRLVGLRSYLPYQAVLIVLHLTAAALLRMVMRRSGVGPWLATATASLFVLFGAGAQNIVWAFQLAWLGSLVFGLAHLLLADHDGPFDRRDWFGVMAGALGLLCSGVAVTMTIVVGVATLIRRGWRIAALHTVPLALLFGAWWVSVGREHYRSTGGPLSTVLRFIVNGTDAAARGIVQWRGAGMVLAVFLVVGLVLAWAPLDRAQLRARAAAPGAMLVGSIVFLTISGIGRANVIGLGPEFARRSRYVYVVCLLAFPAVAVGAHAIARRWRAMGPVVLALILFGIPGNVRILVDIHRVDEASHRERRLRMLSYARVPLADEVPRWVSPDLGVTIGWLLDGVASGRVPDPGPIDATNAADASLRLALHQSGRPPVEGPDAAFRRVVGERAGGERQARRECGKPTVAPTEVVLEEGSSIGIHGGRVGVAYIAPEGARSHSISFEPSLGHDLVALAGPLTLRLDASNPEQPVFLCVQGRRKP